MREARASGPAWSKGGSMIFRQLLLLPSIILIASLAGCPGGPPGAWTPLERGEYREGTGTRLDEAKRTEPRGYDVEDGFLTYWGDGVSLVDIERGKRLTLSGNPACGNAAVSGGSVGFLCWSPKPSVEGFYVPEVHVYSISNGVSMSIAHAENLPGIESMREAALCRQAFVVRARVHGQRRNGLWSVDTTNGKARRLSLENEDVGGFSCRGDTLFYYSVGSSGNLLLVDLSSGQRRSVSLGASAAPRNLRTDGQTAVFEDLRDDAFHGGNVEAFHSSIYRHEVSSGLTERVGDNSSIQLSPDVGSGWIVWQDFRNSARPNYLGSKDQVDIYGRKTGARADTRLSQLSGFAFDPRIGHDMLLYRWRPPGEENAGIFAKNLKTITTKKLAAVLSSVLPSVIRRRDDAAFSKDIHHAF
ncbi:MAG: hypothetical protein PHU25_17660 [Deltaproteobacteria bacterium]|nr:hypothetical protein [Deltaproteobacteria bacterium]